ncbi:MAG: 3-hydroxyacyl-CoA dehydrogenase family protein [Cytophagales bacterium]|nr:3-hydroxyacyl-CoA dehydrogenase family protein [Cytophagales bacterium]
MNIEQTIHQVLRNVSILGAGGKMGKGIALVVLQEMARIESEHYATLNTGNFRLTFIDTRSESLFELKNYLHEQLTKYAEKNIIAIREYFASRQDLVENGDIINYFVLNAINLCNFSTNLRDTSESLLIFEAIFENIDLKEKVYKEILTYNHHQPLFFTNTSSIPIQAICDRTNLHGKVVGFHFYNPPAIQKLVELIFTEDTSEDIKELAMGLGKRFRKTLVTSKDVAGFIGNGHFIREGLVALQLLEELQKEHSLAESIYLLNQLTASYLLRPMGIFQLIDYVGIDVFIMILNTMNAFIEKEELDNAFIKNLLANSVRGGQLDNGLQRDGFLQYTKGKVTGFLTEDNTYQSLSEEQQSACDQLLTSHWEIPAWKSLTRNRQARELIQTHFKQVNANDSFASTLAKRYITQSKNIVEGLVEDQVAQSKEDVHKVLMNGFFHVYGIGDLTV